MSKAGVTQLCAQCGEAYPLADFEMLDEVPLSTPCRRCGFLLFLYAHFKLEAVHALLASDPTMGKIIAAGDTGAVNEYVEKKVGLMRIKA